MALTKEQKKAYEAAFALLDGGGDEGKYRLMGVLEAEKRRYAEALLIVALKPDVMACLEDYLAKRKEETNANA